MSSLVQICKLVIVFLMAIAGYYVYQRFSSGPTDRDTVVRTSTARQVAEFAAADIPLPYGRPMIAVAETAGDYDGIVATQLRKAVERRNATVVELSGWDALLPTRFRTPANLTAEDLAAIAASRKVPYALHCQVNEWTLSPVNDLVIEITLIDVEQSSAIYTNQFALVDCEESPSDHRDRATLVSTTGPASIRGEIGGQSRVLMFTLWIVGGLMLPWLASPMITFAWHSHSNLLSLVIVFGYLAILGAAAWSLWARQDSMLINAGIMLVLSTVWLSYLEFVVRMVEPDVARSV